MTDKEKLTVYLELEPEPLLARRCSRCEGSEFRALVFSAPPYPEGVPDPREVWPELLEALKAAERLIYRGEPDAAGSATHELVIRAIRRADATWLAASNQGQCSVPLAACVSCGRLVGLV